MRLPPLDAQVSDIISFTDELEDECILDPNRQSWDQSKQRWLDLYTGNHFADPLVSTATGAGLLEPELRSQRAASGVVKLVYNRVMNAVLSMLAGQISNPPKVVFGARETGEPPTYYLNGYIQHPALQQIAMIAGQQDDQVQQLASIYGGDHPEVTGAASQIGQSIPLPPELADQVKMLIDQGKMMAMQARMAGMPPPMGVVPPEALIEMTDQTTAQFTQTLFDALWEQSNGIEACAENILNKKILGWQPTLFEADRAKIAYGESPVTLTNIEGSQVLLDPATSPFRPPRYIILTELVSYEEGVAKYPNHADKLAEKSQSGTLRGRVRNAGGSTTSRLMGLNYVRDMCVIRTLWYRDQPYPMSPDEAMGCGKIHIGQVQIEPIQGLAGTSLQPEGQPQPDNSGFAAGEDFPGDDFPGGVVDSGLGVPPIIQQFRQAFLLTETGEEVTPDAPNWPIIYAIREIRDIEGELVFDRRCKLPSIPVVNNINIPVPFSPYGLGEPDRLDGLQMAINRVLSDLVTHHRWNTYPIEIRRKELTNHLNSVAARKRFTPDTAINAPADLAATVGGDLKKLIQYVDIPPMSTDAWRLLEFLVIAIDKEANNAEVNQGEAPAGSSGTWVANLQAAASQVAQVTSHATEAWLKKLTRLYVYFIANDMTVEDIGKYCSKFPPAIIEAFHRRQKSLYLDVTVEIQSGSAATKSGQLNALVAAKQSGLMISDPELLSRLGVDADDQLKQQTAWNQKLVEAGLVADPNRLQQQEPDEKKPPNSQ